MFDADTVRAQAAAMRQSIVTMIAKARSGHPGGSLSSADIVATLYFGGVLRYDPQHPNDPARDRFLLSKGHAAPVQYAALALAGYFERDELDRLRSLGAMLQGHPDALKTPGIEVSTGSLGQGLSICCGIAHALKMDGGDQKVFCLLGDGELQEGQVWEAAMYAAHYRLDNLVAIIDHNGLQIDGFCDEVMSLGDIAQKFIAFGWEVETIDGHEVCAIHASVTKRSESGGPRAVIAMTVKGRGVSFMENRAQWHGNAPSAEQAEQACDEIRDTLDKGDR